MSNVNSTGLPQYQVTSELDKALDAGGLVREAVINIPVHIFDNHSGTSEKKDSKYEGFYANVSGEDKVFFGDEYDDYRYVDVNLSSPEVSVTLGNSLNKEAYDYNHKNALVRKGEPVNLIKDQMPPEILVKNGMRPSASLKQLNELVAELSDQFGLPSTLHIPEGGNHEKGYQQALTELKKVAVSLVAQSDFATKYDSQPAYDGDVLDMTSESYKVFKRDLAKNVARSHANGLLFSFDKMDGEGLSISIQSPKGELVGSLLMTSDFDTEYWERDMVSGEPIEVQVRNLPDVTTMETKGLVTDNFRDLVVRMRKDFSVVSPITEISDLVSTKDINDAVNEISSDVSNTGKKPLILGGVHPDIASAKLTYILSQQYPELVNESLGLAMLEKVVDRENDSQSLGMMQ